MKITVTEAMRLKNEIAGLVQEIVCGSFSCGKTLVDGVPEEESQAEDVRMYMYRVERVLEISQHINSILARFNVESGVADAVRCKHNIELQTNRWSLALSQAEPRKSKMHQVVGDKRVVVETVFEPSITKTDIKDAMRALKARERAIQGQIDRANLQMVELPFEYEDIDALRG